MSSPTVKDSDSAKKEDERVSTMTSTQVKDRETTIRDEIEPGLMAVVALIRPLPEGIQPASLFRRKLRRVLARNGLSLVIMEDDEPQAA